MKQYIILYFGGDEPSGPEEGKKHFARYQEWLQGLGDAVLQPMVPLKHAHTVQSDGTVAEGSSVAMKGYTVVQADSIDQALEYARSCPFLEINGTLEVAEIVQM